MAKIFEIPGKLSVDLFDVSMTTYDDDSGVIYVHWKDPKREIVVVAATPEEFKQFQDALAARPPVGA